MRTKLACSALSVIGIIALWAGTAGAHVTVSPSTLPQGTDDAILDLPGSERVVDC